MGYVTKPDGTVVWFGKGNPNAKPLVFGTKDWYPDKYGYSDRSPKQFGTLVARDNAWIRGKEEASHKRITGFEAHQRLKMLKEKGIVRG